MIKRFLNFFKGLFGAKKEDLGYDPANILITDIHPGWLLDYLGKTWEVIQEVEFDWGDNVFSFEWKITDGTNNKYIYMDDLDGLRICVTDRINIDAIDETLGNAIIDNQEAPTQITYNDIKFVLQADKPCYARDVEQHQDNYLEMLCFEYVDETNQNYLRIEQHGESSFDATIGTFAKDFEFTNITPTQD